MQIRPGGGADTLRLLVARDNPLPELTPFDVTVAGDGASDNSHCIPFAVGVDGEPIAYDPGLDPHLLLGLTGAGKSCLAQGLVYGALVRGWQVFVIDPVKAGADFRFARDPGTIGEDAEHHPRRRVTSRSTSPAYCWARPPGATGHPPSVHTTTHPTWTVTSPAAAAAAGDHRPAGAGHPGPARRPNRVPGQPGGTGAASSRGRATRGGRSQFPARAHPQGPDVVELGDIELSLTDLEDAGPPVPGRSTPPHDDEFPDPAVRGPCRRGSRPVRIRQQSNRFSG